MDILNKKYARQGIHGIVSLFTVEDSSIKVLLVKEHAGPYAGKWILTGGSIYNDEDIESGIRRELKEKISNNDFYMEQFGIYSNPTRTNIVRMVAITYVALVNNDKSLLIENTDDIKWFKLSELPDLGYDHNTILKDSIEYLKKIILKSNIVKVLLPEYFTMPQLTKIYSTLLNKTIDRRNFRKKFLSLNLIDEVNYSGVKKVGKPAKYYKFKDNIIEDKNIF